MELPMMLKTISKSDWLQNYFDLLYDLTLMAPTTDAVKCGFKTDMPVICFAKAVCGGTYLLIGEGEMEKRPVAFVNTDGQAGIVALNFNDFISLIVTMPFWMDVLKFSGGGKLPEMEKAYTLLAREAVKDMNELLEDDGDPLNYGTVQKKIEKVLGLMPVAKPVKVLYDAVTMVHPFRVYSKKDGKTYQNLFSKYITTDNPQWKSKR